MSPLQNAKRLFLDIETSPNLGFFWQSGYKLTIGPDNIVKERAIICIAWKWAGKKKVYCETWDKNQSDKKLLQNFLAIMHEADEVVTHNGDRFDITWIRTRCLKHGIPMSPDFVSIDTLKAARSRFRFNSNRLDYIAKFLGLGQKKPTGFGLWKDITLYNDPKAMRTMVRYCKHDVKLLEWVWDRLNQYVPAKTNRASSLRNCPECDGVGNIKKHTISAAGHRKTQLQCTECGKYYTMARSKLEKIDKEAK